MNYIYLLAHIITRINVYNVPIEGCRQQAYSTYPWYDRDKIYIRIQNVKQHVCSSKAYFGANKDKETK